MEKVRILSLESAGTTCSVTLHTDGVLESEYSVYKPNLHDQLLAELVERTIDDLQLSVDDISAVAVSAGPGSFTGLRISGCIAKALCMGGSPKMIAVPNMKALAYCCIENLSYIDFDSVISTIKAQKDLLYYQVFSKDFNTISEPVFITQDEFMNFDFGHALICGTAAELFPQYFSISDYNTLSAKFIGQLATKMYREHDFVDERKYTPLYIQNFEPKITFSKDF